jgi:cell division protein FtsL
MHVEAIVVGALSGTMVYITTQKRIRERLSKAFPEMTKVEKQILVILVTLCIGSVAGLIAHVLHGHH